MTAPPTDLVAAFERNPHLRGKLTRDVPELAAFRFHYRDAHYRLANFAFGCSIFTWIVANGTTGVWQAINTGLFCSNFYLMFYNEFRARTFTRQLNRRAAEQAARDIIGARD